MPVHGSAHRTVPVAGRQGQVLSIRFYGYNAWCKAPGSDTVSVFPASVSVFAFQCSGSLLQIHFVAAISTKEKSRKNVDFVYFRRAMFGSNPFLCKVKGFFINQRFMCVREEVLLFFRVLLCLF